MSADADAPTLVGEMNPYGADPRFALYPLPERASGHRMQHRVLGIGVTDYVHLRRYNLCVGRWSIRDARKRADEILTETAPEGVVVALGAKVASAFGVVRSTPFMRLGRLVLLPHPSGLCRVWNEAGAVARARAVLREACPAWADRVGLK